MRPAFGVEGRGRASTSLERAMGARLRGRADRPVCSDLDPVHATRRRVDAPTRPGRLRREAGQRIARSASMPGLGIMRFPVFGKPPGLSPVPRGPQVQQHRLSRPGGPRARSSTPSSFTKQHGDSSSTGSVRLYDRARRASRSECLRANQQDRRPEPLVLCSASAPATRSSRSTDRRPRVELHFGGRQAHRATSKREPVGHQAIVARERETGHHLDPRPRSRTEHAKVQPHRPAFHAVDEQLTITTLAGSHAGTPLAARRAAPHAHRPPRYTRRPELIAAEFHDRAAEAAAPAASPRDADRELSRTSRDVTPGAPRRHRSARGAPMLHRDQAPACEQSNQRHRAHHTRQSHRRDRQAPGITATEDVQDRSARLRRSRAATMCAGGVLPIVFALVERRDHPAARARLRPAGTSAFDLPIAGRHDDRDDRRTSGIAVERETSTGPRHDHRRATPVAATSIERLKSPAPTHHDVTRVAATSANSAPWV